MMQALPGDTVRARAALVRGARGRGWTRILNAPRNAAVLDTLRDFAERGVAFEYNRGAIVVKGAGRGPRSGSFVRVPGDERLAAAWIAGALVQSRALTLERVFIGSALREAIALLKKAGARIELRRYETRVFDVRVEPSRLRGFDARALSGKYGSALLALAATAAAGASRFAMTPHTRAAMQFVRALGASVREDGDGFVLDGPQRLRGAAVRCAGDVDLELAAAVASLCTDEDVVLDDGSSLLGAYPHVLDDLRRWNEVPA